MPTIWLTISYTPIIELPLLRARIIADADWMIEKSSESTKNGTLSNENSIEPGFKVGFYRSPSGREPVRKCLKKLDPASRKRIGHDLRRMQLKWPVGMPLVRKLDKGLWEMRSKIHDGIVRVLFTVHGDNLVLLHGWIKKSRKLPAKELDLAKQRLHDFQVRIRK